MQAVVPGQRELPAPSAGDDDERNIGADRHIVRVKLPLTSVSVPTSGDPEGGAPTSGQLTPGVKRSTGALGM